MQLPENDTSARLSRIAADMASTRKQLAQLVIHEADGREVSAPLAASWQELPGRPGVSLYHVPHPDGEPGLYLAVCRIAAGTHFAGSHIDQSQLVALMDGDLACNGRTYRRGEFLWLAPGEPSNWTVRGGYLGVILYDVPPHDLDPEFLTPSP